MDVASRMRVFETLKTRRRHKTTVVITHDLAQINEENFVYVIKEGRVVEQGIRRELEKDCGSSCEGGRGEFRKMLNVRIETGNTLSSVRRLPSRGGLLVPSPPPVEREWRESRVNPLFSPASPVFSTFATTGYEMEPWSRKMRYGDDDDTFAGPTSGTESFAIMVDRRLERDTSMPGDQHLDHNRPRPSLWRAIRVAYPTIPNKPVLVLGLIVCVLSGAMTPLFSFLLSRLLYEVSTGAHNTELINHSGIVVLSVAGLDGLFLGLKYFIMESCGTAWIDRFRKRVLALVLRQDQAWFDKAKHSAVRLVQVLVKDGDDARSLVAVVLGQCLVVGSMFGVGLVWAVVRGWQLALVGFAIVPVFGGVMAVQTTLVAGCEGRNRKAREEVGRGLYVAVGHVKAMRAMDGFEGVFREGFERANEEAMYTAVDGAVAEGCTYGVASGMIYLSEALLFYAGAVLVAEGTYTYLRMLEVLDVVIFTVTIGSQLMTFSEYLFS